MKTSAVVKGDITGFIDISGKKEVGSISQTFRRPLLFEIVRTLLEEDYEEITHEVSDCVAELTNLICGHAKSTLSERGYQFELRPPSVITGEATEPAFFGSVHGAMKSGRREALRLSPAATLY